MAHGSAIPLSASRLADIAERVPVPTYDRTGVRAGVVHLGVGGFHRAHQAMYLDRLLGAGGSPEWGICGVGVLPGDAAMRDVLRRQDGLYTLVLKAADGTRQPRVIGSIAEYLFAPDDPDAIVPVCCGYRFRQQKINVNIAATTHMNANTPMVT